MRALLILAVIVLVGCGSAPSSPVNARRVNAEELGSAWPFTVDEGLVSCIRDGRVITFSTDDAIYAVNAAAQFGRHQKGKNILPIMRSNPKNPNDVMPLNPIEQIGESLCDG
jgi:hypothetical protein